MSHATLFFLLSPLILIEFILMIVSLYDLSRPDRKVLGGSKLVWVLIIVLLNLIGPLLYLTIGREDA
jgi:Phospholipase_D-nuclease N-terminal